MKASPFPQILIVFFMLAGADLRFSARAEPLVEAKSGADPTFSDANWVSISSGIPGANSLVRAVVVDEAGNVYIGGYFSLVGNAAANRIAKWNGSTWSALGTGMNGDVSALAVNNGMVYAGGGFTSAGGASANYVAKYDGTNWVPMGTGLNGRVNALVVSGGDVYVGGNFTSAGGIFANRIAKWNGNSWSQVGGGTDGPVAVLAASGSNIYAGGTFATAGGVFVNKIGRWNGMAWSALGSGMSNAIGFSPSVSALAVSGSDLYAGGNFTNAGGIAAKGVAKWDGTNWSALGPGVGGVPNPDVQSLTVSGGIVYAAGFFWSAGGVAATNIAQWNGTTWSSMGSGLNNSVAALAVAGSNVYVGGQFSAAGETTASYMAFWNGSEWGSLGVPGINNYVNAVTVSGNNLYAGGTFTSVGSLPARFIAQWNGSGWTNLGAGLNDSVYVLATAGTNLYAGGNFTMAGGNPANRIAKWNGSGWTGLGTGVNGAVRALAIWGDDIYVGGDFTTAGGSPANRVAKWNGVVWTPLDSGMSASVRALVMSGGVLYAGGEFTAAGGGAASRIAKWNGSWSQLDGLGLSGTVNAIAVAGSNLYVAGTFAQAGGRNSGSIAKWNGSGWTSLGTGLSGGGASALAVAGDNVYVGGTFTTAGDVAANFIAKWDGTSWAALGQGMDNGVLALAIAGSDLFAGGGFTTAGGKVSPYVARALLPGDPPIVMEQPYNSTNSIGSTASFRVSVSGTPPLIYQWRKNGANLSDGGTIAGATTTNLTVFDVQSTDAGGYSVFVTNAYGTATSLVATLVISNASAMALPGLYLTNATLLPSGIGQFEIRTPSMTDAYTLFYSFDLRVWNFWAVLTGTNRYFMQTPGPIRDLGSVFAQLAPLGQTRHDLSFDFRRSWHGRLSNGVPAVTWPQAFQYWQADLVAANSTNLPPDGTVFLNGPAGSGLSGLSTSFESDDQYAGSYDSDLFALPPVPPGGKWTVTYGGGNLTLSKHDPQVAARSVAVLPRFAITNNQLHGVSWTYIDPGTGALLPVQPSFLSRINFSLFGHNFTECGAEDSEVLYREFSIPGITNFEVSPPVLWSNVMFQVQYIDTLDNRFTVNYAFGNQYEVWGANSLPPGIDCDPGNAGFTLLGSATNTATFLGTYNYYLVRVPKHNVVKVDTVRGSNGAYFGTSYSSNVEDVGRIGGAPDNLFALAGPTPRGFYSGGFFVINTSGMVITSVTVYIVP